MGGFLSDSFGPEPQQQPKEPQLPEEARYIPNGVLEQTRRIDKAREWEKQQLAGVGQTWESNHLGGLSDLLGQHGFDLNALLQQASTPAPSTPPEATPGRSPFQGVAEAGQGLLGGIGQALGGLREQATSAQQAGEQTGFAGDVGGMVGEAAGTALGKLGEGLQAANEAVAPYNMPTRLAQAVQGREQIRLENPALYRRMDELQNRVAAGDESVLPELQQLISQSKQLNQENPEVAAERSPDYQRLQNTMALGEGAIAMGIAPTPAAGVVRNAVAGAIDPLGQAMNVAPGLVGKGISAFNKGEMGAIRVPGGAAGKGAGKAVDPLAATISKANAPVRNAIMSTGSGDAYVVAGNQRLKVQQSNYGGFGRLLGDEIYLADGSTIDSALVMRVEDSTGKVLYERPTASAIGAAGGGGPMTGEPVGLAMGGLKQIGRAEETGGQAARLMDAAGNLLGKPSKVEKALDVALEVPGRAAPEAAQIVGPGGELLSTIAPKGAIVRTAEGVEKAPVAISAETMARLPNLSKIDAPEDVIATLARTAEANPDLIDRFRRGTITHDELVTDLAPRLGMTAEDFLRSKPGKALNEQELLVLRATVVDKARSLAEMAQQINTRGGIGALSDVEKAEAMRQLVDAGRLQAVARGAASTAGRSLNQQKIQIDTLLAQALVGKNEQRAAERALAAAQSKQARLQTRMDELEKARAAGQLSRDEAAELMRVRREAEAAAQEERAALFRRQAAREKDAKAALRQQEQAGKALEALGGRDVTEKVLKEFLDLQASDDPLAAAKFVKGLQQPSWWNRASIIRYGSMLSATSSHLANTTSNVIMSAVDLGMKPLAAGIDAARAAITGGPRTRYLAEASPQAQGMLEGAITGAKQAWTVLETGINPSDAGKLEHVRAGFGVNPAVDAIVEMPMRLMEAADLILRGAATGGNFRALAVRQAIKEGYKGKLVAARVQEIVQNAEDFPELVDRAQKLGARIVVQEKRAVTTYLSGMRRVPGLNYVSEVMLPFLRTPYNIAAQGVGLTPVGFLGVVNDIRRGRPGEAADTAARALFGTATMGVATSLAAQGFLTGAYPEDARERGVLPPGWQPWSVRIPHSDGSATYVSYQNLGPIGVPLALASLLGQDMAKGKAAPTPEYLGKIVASMAKYMSDQTFLRGIGDLVKAIDQPGRYAENLVESLATQIVPYGSLQRQLTRALDMGTRDPKGAMEAILALNPMTAGGVPAKLDPFGQPVHPAQTGIGSFISPSRYNVETPDPVLAEYRRLQAEGQDVGISKAPSKIFSVELTRDEQRQFQAQAGQMLREALTRLIPTRPYRALSDEDKATVLSRLEDAIRKTVAEQMAVSMGREFIRRHPDVQKEMKKQ